MYFPYISLIKKIFPNALIIIDVFHIIQLISRALNKTRIMIMKNDKVNYNKLKRYQKLLLKSRDELNYEKWKKYTCFNKFITESDVVNYIINTNIELKNTYDVYQSLLSSIKNKNYNLFIHILNNHSDNISSYMKTFMKNLKIKLKIHLIIIITMVISRVITTSLKLLKEQHLHLDLLLDLKLEF